MQIYYYRVFRQECRVFPVAVSDFSNMLLTSIRWCPAQLDICVRAMHGCEKAHPPTPNGVKQS